MSLLVALGLFFTGLIQDALSALYLRLVNADQFFWAAVLSIFHTLLGYGVWVAIVDQLLKGGWGNLVIYAVGGGVGTYLAFMGRKDKDKPSKQV